MFVFYKICSKISKNILDFDFLFTYSIDVCASKFVRHFRKCSSKILKNIRALENCSQILKKSCLRKTFGNSKFVRDIKIDCFCQKVIVRSKI